MATSNKQLFLEVEMEEDEHDSLVRTKRSTASTKKGDKNPSSHHASSSTTYWKTTGLMWLAFVVVVLLATSHLNQTVADVEVKRDGSSASTNTTSTSTVIKDEEELQLVSFTKPGGPTSIRPSTNKPIITTTPSPTIPPVPPAPPGFQIPEPYDSASYIRRGKPLTNDQSNILTERWGGGWTFETRSNAIPLGYPNNDVPWDQFPIGSWQVDSKYLEQFLPVAIAFAEMALEAILDEYGHGKHTMPNVSFTERSYMFSITLRPERSDPKHPKGNGGEATKETLDAIRKRLLHAIVTESEFRFVMGGHSAAAGHGNIFQQSYTLQVQKVMEPFLARLGVYFQAHNFGMGGLGTSQNALGAKDLYGRSDILMWDSGMTEGDGQSQDLFARIGLLLHQPILWGNPAAGERYGSDNNIRGGLIDTGQGSYLPLTDDLEEIENMPFWARYMNCSEALRDECKKFRYNATCWASFRDDDGDDGGSNNIKKEPPQPQRSTPGGQASWHPGNREHNLRGRTIAFVLIEQTLNALKDWYNAPNYKLADEAWHITPDKERVKAGVLAVKDTQCGKFELLPPRICNIPFNARSEMTPRRDPDRTSLRSIMKGGCTIPNPLSNIYDPPEPYRKELFHPDIDIVHILENGKDFPVNRARQEAVMERRLWQQQPIIRKPITSGLEPGKGWYLNTKSNPSTCDGTWDSFCGRSASDCIMYGHNDYRGGLMFDGLSGWMMFHLENMEHGLLVIRIEDWMDPGSNPKTKDWKCVNNKDCSNATTARRLDGDTRCSDWRFEFAIDGKISSWDSLTFIEKGKRIQRVVPLWVLLDNDAWGDIRDIELAIRIVGCGRDSPLHLSHIYWA